MESLDHITRGDLRQMQRRERDKRRYIKITTLLMLDIGFSTEQTSTALGIDPSTVTRLVERYKQSDSLEHYLQDSYKPYKGQLTQSQLIAMEKELTESLYQSTAEVAAYIQEQFAVEYSLSGVVALLKRLGFVYKKTRLVPAKADRSSQEEFLATLSTVLARQKKGDSVYFCDAVHPQHNTRSSYGWIKSGETFEIRSNSGRHRVNIHGAINAHDVTRVVVREDDRINADSVINLFKSLQQRQRTGTIYVICDNARYYRSRVVKEWLATSRIVQIFLPSYSPNLNLIERLWKFMHKKVIDAYYYPTKEEFREAILTFFAQIKEHKSELQSLMTLNFQII